MNCDDDRLSSTHAVKSKTPVGTSCKLQPAVTIVLCFQVGGVFGSDLGDLRDIPRILILKLGSNNF